MSRHPKICLKQREILCRQFVRINVKSWHHWFVFPAYSAHRFKMAQRNNYHPTWELIITISTLHQHVSQSVSRTYTGRSGRIPLCEGSWHGPALNGAGSFQQVTWTAFEPDHRASRELRTDPPAVARLWYRAALAVAGARHSCSTSMATINSRKWSGTLTIHR